MKFQYSILPICLLLSLPEPARGESYTNPDLHYSFEIPEGWIQIPGDDLETLVPPARRTREPPVAYTTGYQILALRAFELPYLLVQHVPGGDSAEQLSKVSSGELNQSARDYSISLQLATGAVFGKPILDPVRKMVLTVMEAQSPPDGLEIRALAVAAPGTEGTVGMLFYSRASEWEDDLPIFEELLDSFRFASGYEYDSASSLATYVAAPTDWARMLGRMMVPAALVGGLAALYYRSRKKKIY